MMKITPDDLVRYVYSETSPEKSASIKEALQIDENLRDEYEKIKTMYDTLETTNLSPRKQTIDNIMEYAAKKNRQVHSL